MPERRTDILVAEDDDEVRHLIRVALERAGYRLELARDGQEALTALRRLRFDGLVLDINMPHVDGFDVLGARSNLPGFPPVLMLTARHAAGDIKRAVELGASDYLTKPFSQAQLLARVQRLTRRRSPAPAAPSEMLL